MTEFKPEVSKKNPYYIPKHRYYELKHFCLQYPIWKKAYESLDGLSKQPSFLNMLSTKHDIPDPTGNCAMARDKYGRKMGIVEFAAQECDEYKDDSVIRCILIGVTEGKSYEYLQTKYNLRFSRAAYYECYRRFFWILDRLRD